jgi:sigma-E factor negative regulatory protein RseC
MIEERGRVISADAGYAWVEAGRRTSCGSCIANQGCGTATLAKVLGQRRTRIRVLTPMPVQAGDEVIIGVAENALIRSSLTVYMVPLLMMFGGALVGDRVFVVDSEGIIVLLAIGGLLGGFVGVWLLTRGMQKDSRFQPVVLRRLSSNDTSSATIPSS